ncbi:MAG TPA: MFS transporter [Gemmataceae bacterium]|nr:MFS transporter [Gemmataceae bacterium]
MNQTLSSIAAVEQPTRVRYRVLGFAAVLSMITYLDRVCFGTVAPHIQEEFGLSDTQKGLLFSAFALAYAAFEVPSGWLGDVYGSRRTLIRIVLWWSAFTALTGLISPVAAIPWFAFTAMLSVRFLFGVGEAGAYPNITRTFYSWFPFKERGRAQGVVWMAGRFGGGITGLVVLALFYKTVVDGREVTHWRHVFWIFGMLGVIWCILWWWWFREKPEENPAVNAAELALIQGAEHERGPAGHGNVPWRRLLTSGNLWILCGQYFCAAYGWYFNITWLPGYLKEKYGVTADSFGYWSTSLMVGAPLLLGSCACFVGGILTDLFIQRTGNRKWGRRLFGVVGHGTCAACYLLSVYARNPWLFVLGIALAAFCNDMTMGSAWASCLDIGKRYSGIVSGCMNTVGNLGGAIAGVMTGRIVDWFTQSARENAMAATSEAASSLLATSANVGGPLNALTAGAVEWDKMVQAQQQLQAASDLGWKVNFVIFGLVYVAATLFWLGFDSTKPIVPEKDFT